MRHEAIDAQEQTLRTLADLLVTQNGDYRDIFTTRKTYLTRLLGSVYSVPVTVATGWEAHEYPEGDPRASELFRLLRSYRPRSRELTFAFRVADVVRDQTGEHPSLDFALATLSRVLGLPRGSGLIIFACGRSIGWIGHVIEQYTAGALIRPRARYVGEPPVNV